MTETSELRERLSRINEMIKDRLKTIDGSSYGSRRDDARRFVGCLEFTRLGIKSQLEEISEGENAGNSN